MKTIQEIKKEKEQLINKLIDATRMFFAFSMEQFEQSKTEKEEDEKYVPIGTGAYLPKSQVDNFTNGFEEIEKWYQQEVKVNEQRIELIKYELSNYESYYTGDYTDALEALGDEYSEEEVREIFFKERLNNN